MIDVNPQDAEAMPTDELALLILRDMAEVDESSTFKYMMRYH